MKKIKIPNSEVRELVSGKTYSFPKYTTQLMNLANSNAQGTRPHVVGQMSDLIQEFPGRTISGWQKWYLEKQPEAIENATEKVYAMIRQFQEVIDEIDKEMVRNWVEELVIIKTFSGLRFQDAILKRVGQAKSTTCRLAMPEEESRGIDGYIGDMPVSIKPISYKSKILNERIDASLIFYNKKKDGITIEYDF
ncbi:MjaI family restriction endonuclease [Sinomicrobium kalidii]|uniref:MjaI family restriction endonuclease n=1 Tax=Sinomicrobium kalidii TaxID=2900738 RepID=UPI001E32D317|nr:MjaI family restriction endonuclease [Sinomicrobium kalidii]UGU17946.1 MjaI family restriction endonuclease [Sinomicrobium kalidii]